MANRSSYTVDKSKWLIVPLRDRSYMFFLLFLNTVLISSTDNKKSLCLLHSSCVREKKKARRETRDDEQAPVLLIKNFTEIVRNWGARLLVDRLLSLMYHDLSSSIALYSKYPCAGRIFLIYGESGFACHHLASLSCAGWFLIVRLVGIHLDASSAFSGTSPNTSNIDHIMIFLCISM